jgi:cysteine desulfurase
VLDAMGVDFDLAACAIRLSLGWSTTEADALRFVTTFENVVGSLSERKNRRAA